LQVAVAVALVTDPIEKVAVAAVLVDIDLLFQGNPLVAVALRKPQYLPQQVLFILLLSERVVQVKQALQDMGQTVTVVALVLLLVRAAVAVALTTRAVHLVVLVVVVVHRVLLAVQGQVAKVMLVVWAMWAVTLKRVVVAVLVQLVVTEVQAQHLLQALVVLE
jgi:hypothetical protein